MSARQKPNEAQFYDFGKDTFLIHRYGIKGAGWRYGYCKCHVDM